MTRLELRPYQVDALDRVTDCDTAGERSLLGVAATGLGKTVMFVALAERMGCRTLILAHRDELISQAARKVQEMWPTAPSIGRVQGPHDDVRSHVVVASVQTLARGHRLARLVDPPATLLRPSEPFGLVIVDEAHHAAADTYRRVISALNAGQDGGPLLLGVTATPDRGDGRGLDAVFGSIVFDYDILWGIRSGYLSDLRGLAVELDDLDLDRVKVTRGDYQAGDAGRAMSDAGAPATIADAWLEHAAGRRTLCFTPTVATAMETREAFTARGFRAAAVYGDMDPGDRRSTLRAYTDGELDVVVNCMVLTEGYDDPRTDCIVVARPTQSRALYTQMVGRGTRRHPDKTDCLVLDVVGAARQHSLVTVATLFGIPDRMRRAAGDASRTVADMVADHEAAEVAAGRLRAQEVELFAQLRTAMTWVATHRDGERRRYVLDVGARGERIVLLHVNPDDPGSWGVQLQVTRKGEPDRVRTLLRDADVETCQAAGEDYVRRFGDQRMVDPDAAWRHRKPTPRQRHAASKWHLPDIDSYETAGALSDALGAHIERVRLKRRAKARAAG